MHPRPFTLEEERYLVTQLSQADDRVATKALQWMCERTRAGWFFTDASKVRAVVRFCLHRTSPNARRWAVNALGEIGAGSDLTPVLELLPAADNDPDLLTSIVATIFSGRSDEESAEILGRFDIPIEGLALIAAAQFSPLQKRRLIATRVPLETSDPAELRAAIILAGTDKGPEHLFDQKFPNAISLSQLNLHDVSSVSKYSIWALAQLNLGFSALQLPLSDFESSPPEVRKWILRLLFSDPSSLAKHLDMVSVAQRDPSREVREESAIELRDIFVLGLDKYVSDWLFKEDHHEAHKSLLDHMAAQSDKSARYPPIVTEFYRKSPPKSDSRIRIEAAAAGTSLYRDLRKIDYEDESGFLFHNDNDSDGRLGMVTINQDFSGSHIGAVTASGGISANTIAAVAQADAPAKEILEKALGLIAGLDQSPRTEGERLIQEVASRPSKSGWEKLVSFLKGTKETVVALGGTVEGVDGMIDSISDLAGLG